MDGNPRTDGGSVASVQSDGSVTSVGELGDTAQRVLEGFQACDKDMERISSSDVEKRVVDISKANISNHVRRNLLPGGFVTRVGEVEVEQGGQSFTRYLYSLTEKGRAADPESSLPSGVDAGDLWRALQEAKRAHREDADRSEKRIRELESRVAELEAVLGEMADYLAYLSDETGVGRFEVAPADE